MSCQKRRSGRFLTDSCDECDHLLVAHDHQLTCAVCVLMAHATTSIALHAALVEARAEIVRLLQCVPAATGDGGKHALAAIDEALNAGLRP